MKILITGIHGFVGSNLIQAFGSKHTIYGLDIVSPQKEGVVKTFLWSEIEQLPEVDLVIHLAGKAHDTKNQTVAQVYFDVNTGLTQKIYDWFLNSSSSKFIFFSTVKAAADKVDGAILYEDIVPSPVGPYGESKIEAENYILSHQPKPDLNKQFYIFRPCMIHGPGNKGNLNLLYAFVNKGIPYPLGAFENRRSFTSIDNLIFIIGELIVQQVLSGIYNIADDEPLSTNQLIDVISTTLNRPTRIWNIQTSLISFVARAGSVLHLPLNTERLQKLTENYVVSNQKIKDALGIKTLPITAVDGLKSTIESFKNQ